nr:AAA family ATPase [Bacteroidota bacterium]
MDHPAKSTHKSQNEATVLIAEILGLSELSSQLPPDQFTGLMNECFEFVIKKIELYGGTVSNLDGENIKAVFGIPEPLAEAPVKAVDAAIDLMERFKLFNQIQELSEPIYLRVGLETGTVIVSKVTTTGQSQYNVFGETVNMAQRIRDFAEKDQILVGPNLYAQVQNRFEFFAMEPVPLKGQKEPLPIFELKRKKKKEVKTDETFSRMISSEMVGRQSEFERLQNGIFNLINSGKGSAINIIGKAGIGKSRLMAEIREKELVKKIALFEGRALSNGQNLSFHPIIQIIKSWAGISEENSTEESRSKLESNIRRIYPDAFDEIFPFIATMMGYRLEGKARERIKDIKGEALEILILKNMRDLLSSAASIRPFIIIIEDAHWCDISSVILMESLFKLARKHRILFVNVFRPGYQETGERIQNFLIENLKDIHHEINVESLTEEESELLINNLLQHANLPEEINSLIIGRASGNPFFIEEVIRSFIDEGLIKIKGDQFIPAENIKYANIPESIDNVLLSRIDRLDDKTKDLLKTASVIGRNFYFKVLEEAAQTIEEVDNKLEYLKDVQLINERKQKDEVEFLFKHALAQQATYDSIVERSRKDLHLKIARSIEKVFAGRIHEFYGTLAHHYSKAEQQYKTEEYLIKAGDESMKTGASSEAVNFLKKALETHIRNTRNLPDHQKVVDLEEKLGFALYAVGQYTEAVECFDKVIYFYHKSIPKTDFQRKMTLPYSLFVMLKIIYFNRPNRDKTGAAIEKKILTVMEPKNRALLSVDPIRSFHDY